MVLSWCERARRLQGIYIPEYPLETERCLTSEDLKSYLLQSAFLLQIWFSPGNWHSQISNGPGYGLMWLMHVVTYFLKSF